MRCLPAMPSARTRPDLMKGEAYVALVSIMSMEPASTSLKACDEPL